MNNSLPPRHFVGFDIIGDVHGCASLLERLLIKLGYQETENGFVYHDQEHPRQVIFVGDLIDRGAEIQRVLSVVYQMWQQGNAQCVLGNHELSAIAWFTRYQQDYVRQHSERGYKQLEATLTQFATQQAILLNYIEWFKQWPLFLELPEFRVVHACWDAACIQQYKHRYQSDYVTPKVLEDIAANEQFALHCVARLTRGLSIALPKGYEMRSFHGFMRHRFRVKFWTNKGDTHGDIVFQPDPLPEVVAKRAITEEERAQLLHYAITEKPVFVGHYWMRGEPAAIQSNIACLDYSAVNQGKLVAYRFHVGDKTLSQQQFCYVTN